MVDITHRFDRWMYRGGRPRRVARFLNGVWAALAGAGVGPRRVVRLEVTGRRSGQLISFPVVVADYQGERYLVSMLGDGANWVRNVRAAGGDAVLRHGDREDVKLEEVQPGDRGPILRRYLECAPGGRAHIPIAIGAPSEEVDRVAAGIPVFRIRPRASSPAGAAGCP